MGEQVKHPDLVELDAARTGEAGPETAQHVLECPDCRASLDSLKSLPSRLESLDEPTVEVPEAVDRAILDMAALKMRRPKLPAWLPLSAAAGLILALGLGLLLGPSLFQTPDSKKGMAGRTKDIDQSGKVDILDAYYLSSKIKAGGPLDPEWDVDHDGDVDDEDVDAIAQDSVSLEGEIR